MLFWSKKNVNFGKNRYERIMYKPGEGICCLNPKIVESQGDYCNQRTYIHNAFEAIFPKCRDYVE